MRNGTTRSIRQSLGLVLTAVLAGFTAAGADQPGFPQPLPADVRMAWEKAGAVVGWMAPEQAGFAFRSGIRDGKRREAPAFSLTWSKWQPGVIAKLPAPEQGFALDLSATKVTNEGLKEIAAFEQLLFLDVCGTEVTDAGLKELAGFKELLALNLSGNQITDAGLKELAALPRLQALYIEAPCGGGKVTDAGIKEIARLRRLETLCLPRTQITDAGLKELATLQQLQWLNVVGANVTRDGMHELRRALPGLQIVR